MKRKAKRGNKAIIVAAVSLAVLLLIFTQQITVTNQQRIRASASSGESFVVCKLFSGQLISVPTRFLAIDVTSPDGRFIIQPGLSLPSQEVSERIDIWTGRFDINKVFATNKSVRDDLGVTDAIERILFYRLTEVDSRFRQMSDKLERITDDLSRGPGSLAHQVTLRQVQNLEQEGEKLVEGLLRLYRLTGVTTSPYPCQFLGLEIITKRQRRSTSSSPPSSDPDDSSPPPSEEDGYVPPEEDSSSEDGYDDTYDDAYDDGYDDSYDDEYDDTYDDYDY